MLRQSWWGCKITHWGNLLSESGVRVVTTCVWGDGLHSFHITYNPYYVVLL